MIICYNSCITRRRKAYEKREFFEIRGGASPLGTDSKGFGELLPSPLEGEGRISKFAKLTKKFNPAVVGDKAVSEAHRKELNVLTSYRLNDFKKKAGATHVDMSANIRRAAFTLAEVLITLAIIGIVAAMTIPTISHNIQHAVLKTQFKKFYSTFYQAILSVQTREGRPMKCFYWIKNPYCQSVCSERNEYGSCITWVCENGDELPDNYNGFMTDCSSFQEELFLNTLKTTKICEDHAYEQGCLPENFRGVDVVRAEKNPDQEYDPNSIFSDSGVKNKYPVYILSDGMYIIGYSSKPFSGMPLFLVDINGHKGPNKWGYDIFTFRISGDAANGIRNLKGIDYFIESGGTSFNNMYNEAFNIK